MSSNSKGTRLLLAPIFDWLVDFFDREDNTFEGVADESGIDQRTLRRWVAGECKTASLVSIDTFLTAVGRPDLFSLLGSE